MNDVPNASLGYCRENGVRIQFAPTSPTKVAVANNHLVLAKSLDSPTAVTRNFNDHFAVFLSRYSRIACWIKKLTVSPSFLASFSSPSMCRSLMRTALVILTIRTVWRTNASRMQQYLSRPYPASKCGACGLHRVNGDYWRFQLETAQRYGDGVVLWGPDAYPWNDKSGWWDATEQFAASLHAGAKD
jgi:hypothetical protein